MAEGNHWSFVKCSKKDRPDLATEVKEKERISNNCSVGTYLFTHIEDIMDFAKKVEDKQMEKYIAPIYQTAIDEGKDVYIEEVSNVLPMGTPAEVIKSFNITIDELRGENGINNSQRGTLVIDVDGTILKKNSNEAYSEAQPIQATIDRLREANDNGYYIVLFTARNMRTFIGSEGLINKYTSPILLTWLSENNVPYDEIYFGKPWGENVVCRRQTAISD